MLDATLKKSSVGIIMNGQWQNKGAVHEPTGNKDSARENAPNFCRVPWKNFTELNISSPIFFQLTLTAGKMTITITYQGTILEIQKNCSPYYVHVGRFLTKHFNSTVSRPNLFINKVFMCHFPAVNPPTLPNFSFLNSCSFQGCSSHGCSSHGCSSHGCSSHGCSSHGCSSHGCSSHGCSSHDCSSHGCSSHCCSSHSCSSHCSSHCCSSHGCSSHGFSSHGCSFHGCSSHGCSSHGCSSCVRFPFVICWFFLVCRVVSGVLLCLMLSESDALLG
jgi:hypothetical protein